jgi:hypothetical protein
MPSRQTIYNREKDLRRLQELAGETVTVTRETTDWTHRFVMSTRDGDFLYRATRYEVAYAFLMGYQTARLRRLDGEDA